MSNPRAGLSSNYIPTLDGWRAIAILGVIFYHDLLQRVGPLSTSFLHKHGNMGVDLFFAISGLLIVTRLLNEESTYGTVPIRNFYVRRAFRILPAALLYLGTIAILHTGWSIPSSRGELMAAALFVRNYWVQHHHELNDWFTGHFWSLAIEEQFYLVIPTVLLIVKKSRTRIIAIGCATVAFFVWSLIAPRVLPSVYDNAWSGARTEVHVHGILAAVLLALLLRVPAVRQWFKRVLNPYATVGAIVLIGLVFHALSMKGFTRLLPLLFPALILSTVLQEKTAFSRILEWPPLRLIGRMSYSIYLWQQLFFMPETISTWHFPWMDSFPLSFLGAGVCAAGSYYLVEKPLIKLGRQFVSDTSTLSRSGTRHRHDEIASAELDMESREGVVIKVGAETGCAESKA